MKRLHLFLIKSFLPPFISTFFIAIFLLLMQFLWKYIDDLAGKGLELSQIIQLIFYASARFVPLAIPIAMLIASVMVFGKLGEQNELIALKSSGISSIQIFKPLFMLVITISIGSFLFSNHIMPIANLKNATMIYNIQRKKPALNIKEGIFYKDIEGFSIKIAKKESDNKTLKNIIIYDHTYKKGYDKVIIAEKGIMEFTKDDRYLELTLFNGSSYTELIDKKNKKNKAHRKMQFKEHLIRFDLSSFSFKQSNKDLYKGHYAMMTNKQLNDAIDSLNHNILDKNKQLEKRIQKEYQSEKHITTNKKRSYGYNNKHKYDLTIKKLKTLKIIIQNHIDNLDHKRTIVAKHKIEWHRKIVLATACFIFFLIGAPLGSIIRKGGFGMPVMISVFFFLFFHIFSMIGEKSAKELTIDPFLGMWITSIIFFPISLFLIYKASKDAISLSINTTHFFYLIKKNN